MKFPILFSLICCPMILLAEVEPVVNEVIGSQGGVFQLTARGSNLNTAGFEGANLRGKDASNQNVVIALRELARSPSELKYEVDRSAANLTDLVRMKDRLVTLYLDGRPMATDLTVLQLRVLEGPQGASGVAGPQGAIGPQGPIGLKGDKGETGERGPIGLTGSVGPAGPKGDQGVEGVAGSPGAKGDKGDKGDRGEKGEKGETGEQGPIGLTGSMGPKGDKGDQGEVGERGPIGLTGSAGPAGPKGDVGPIGLPGVQGPIGIKGDRGEKGETGERGSIGLTGSTGPAGPKGDPGATGPQGPAGVAGAKGDKGDKGDRGEKGERGLVGATGPQGPAGSGSGDPTEILDVLSVQNLVLEQDRTYSFPAWFPGLRQVKNTKTVGNYFRVDRIWKGNSEIYNNMIAGEIPVLQSASGETVAHLGHPLLGFHIPRAFHADRHRLELGLDLNLQNCLSANTGRSFTVYFLNRSRNGVAVRTSVNATTADRKINVAVPSGWARGDFIEAGLEFASRPVQDGIEGLDYFCDLQKVQGELKTQTLFIHSAGVFLRGAR